MLIDTQTNEIFVYDPIGESFFDDGITAELMVQALKEMGGKRVTVRINSPGGSADEGIAIYNALKRYDGGIDTVVDSVAASAASIIALAGESRTTAKGGKWMIHRAMTFAMGNQSEMIKVAGILQKYDESIIEIYGESMNVDSADIEVMLDAETWFSGDEAMAVGLSTGPSIESVDDVEPAVAAWFKHPPKAVQQSKSTVAVPKYAAHRRAAEIKNRTHRLRFV